jgi:hypothetical protein
VKIKIPERLKIPERTLLDRATDLPIWAVLLIAFAIAAPTAIFMGYATGVLR